MPWCCSKIFNHSIYIRYSIHTKFIWCCVYDEMWTRIKAYQFVSINKTNFFAQKYLQTIKIYSYTSLGVAEASCSTKKYLRMLGENHLGYFVLWLVGWCCIWCCWAERRWASSPALLPELEDTTWQRRGLFNISLLRYLIFPSSVI